MAVTGRPTKYRKEYAEQAGKLCLKGFIDTDLADFFGVEEKTINNWKKAHPEFLQALKSGKRHSDDLVEDSLYNRALGYEYKELKEEESEQGVKKTVTTKQLAGDTTAQIFWLKNRRPERWRDKQEIEQKTEVRHVMPVPTADSVEDWESIAGNQQDELLSGN